MPRTDYIAPTILYTAYCCTTTLAVIGNYRRCYAARSRQTPLTGGANLPILGVQIPSSIVQNGRPSKTRTKCNTRVDNSLLPPCYFCVSDFLKDSRSCCCKLKTHTFAIFFTMFFRKNTQKSQSPTLLKKNVTPYFDSLLCTQKETDTFSESLKLYLSLLLFVGRLLSQPRKRHSASFSFALW